jgi:hypothetical protein
MTNQLNKIRNLMRKGYTDKEIGATVKTATHYISLIRQKLQYPQANTIRILLANPEIKDEFKKIYKNKLLNHSQKIEELRKLTWFKRQKINKHTVTNLRYFYGFKANMPENNYKNDYDRIRGYIVRNTKFMAKRRGLKFNLTYEDFEIPKYCPLLGIKLTYLNESKGTHFSHSSLDRIDNSKGYIKGNVMVISRLANAMKNEADFDQLELFAKNILKLVSHYKNQGALGSITDIFGPVELKLNLGS